MLLINQRPVCSFCHKMLPLIARDGFWRCKLTLYFDCEYDRWQTDKTLIIKTVTRAMWYNRIDQATLIHSYFVLVKLHSYLQNTLRYIRVDIAFSLLRHNKKTARNLEKKKNPLLPLSLSNCSKMLWTASNTFYWWHCIKGSFWLLEEINQ